KLLPSRSSLSPSFCRRSFRRSSGSLRTGHFSNGCGRIRKGATRKAIRGLPAASSRLRGLALPFLLAKHAPLYLAGRRHRQRVDEFNLLWILVRRQILAHVLADVFLECRGGRVPGGKHDERLDDVAARLVRRRNDSGVGDGRMTHEAVLDFRRPYPVARGLEHVVGASLIPEIAIRIPRRE